MSSKKQKRVKIPKYGKEETGLGNVKLFGLNLEGLNIMVNSKSIINDKNVVSIGPDSLYIPKFIQNYIKEDTQKLFTIMKETGPFIPRSNDAMKYRGNELNRTKFFLTKRESDDPRPEGTEHFDKPPNKIKKYGYTGWQWESMLFYRYLEVMPCIESIVNFFEKNVTYSYISNEDINSDNSSSSTNDDEDQCNEEINFPNTKPKKAVINHVIGTLYETGSDGIGYHNDKTKDLTEHSLIYILSFGCSRELHIKENESKKKKIINMEDGSLFVLGPITNEKTQHSIVEDDKKVSPRISLVLRDAKTLIDISKVNKQVEKSKKTKLAAKLKENSNNSNKRKITDPAIDSERQSDKESKRPKKKQKISTDDE